MPRASCARWSHRRSWCWTALDAGLAVTTRLTLALVGERDERIVAHRAIEAALPLAARALDIAIDARWLLTVSPWSWTSPSNDSWISQVDLANKNAPPAMRIKSFAVKSIPHRENRFDCSSVITHEAANSNRIRPMAAIASPSCRAIARFSGGNRPVRIAMNTRLSTPSTTSSAVSATNASSDDVVNSSSITKS